jgi:hypothetical protein
LHFTRPPLPVQIISFSRPQRAALITDTPAPHLRQGVGFGGEALAKNMGFVITSYYCEIL